MSWPAPSTWVFIAQLGEHCSANAEASGSNPVEAPKNVFSGYFRNCLNCDSLRWSHTHFICIPAVHIISFSETLNWKTKKIMPIIRSPSWISVFSKATWYYSKRISNDSNERSRVIKNDRDNSSNCNDLLVTKLTIDATQRTAEVQHAWEVHCTCATS